MLNHRRREWGRSVPRLFCPAPAGRRFSALRLEDRRQRGDDFPRGASSGKPGAFPRSTVGSRSRTEQPCHTLCKPCPDHRSGRVAGRRAPGRTDSARVRRTPWRGGVHNRFAGRPEPMAWRPSGEFRFMVRTQNRVRSRLSLRRHRPSLEQLDERCLLSTGAGTSLPHSAASHPYAAALRAHIPARQPLHDREISRSTTIKVNTVHTAQPATPLERPAGTLLTGTPTAFDPIVGAAAARQEYGVDGTGMTVAVIDTGVDYNNPALGGGFGPAQRSSRGTTSPPIPQIPWRPTRSTVPPLPG